MIYLQLLTWVGFDLIGYVTHVVHITFVCMNMSFYIWSGCFYVVPIKYINLQKKVYDYYIIKVYDYYYYILPLSRIHNTSFTSAYFGQDNWSKYVSKYLLLSITQHY
jgi:hypothetical protein